MVPQNESSQGIFSPIANPNNMIS
jgi:hypothetical protein